MTDLEYNEIKERLKADGLLVVKDEKAINNSKQHCYFKAASQYVCDRFCNSKRGKHAGWGSLYENARRIVMWTYGASKVIDMPDDKKEEANQFVIDICERAIKTMEELG